ncbi:MAG: hypothetical protein LKI59_04035 [Bacteroidales bacterium]|jgi:hypothetical protein|nr:hypothetical protein [Bacteroidales bacterium]
MKKILILLCLFIAGNIYSQNKSIDWDADLDILSEELSEKHCNLFAVESKDVFLDGINSIKSESQHLTDIRTALKVQQLIAKMGDSHTSLQFYPLIDRNKVLPVNLFQTSDGLYIIRTTSKNKAILESRILAINGFPIQTVIDSLSTLLTVDNRAIVKIGVPKLIPYLQILEYFGFADKTMQVNLKLGSAAGGTENYVLRPAIMNRTNRVSFKPDSLAFCVKNERVFFTDCYYSYDKIYYMLYNECWSKELELKYGDKAEAESMPSFKAFEKKSFKVLRNNDIEKIVFDLRYNGGGYSQQGTKFIEKLSRYLHGHPQIKVYVVIGRETFSSAILNAMDFKRLTNAVFVGEETAGKPNHYGEVGTFQLPSSKLTVRYSTKFFKRTDEDLKTIMPDYTIEMSFRDLKTGIDPVIEWIKKQ